MKYEKPSAVDLNKLSISEGACASGTFVGTCTNLAGGLAGDCLANGSNAGTCSGSGAGVSSTCTQGVFGTNTQCATGGFATP